MQERQWLRRMSPIILSVMSHLLAYALLGFSIYFLLGFGWAGISTTVFVVFLLSRLADYMPLLSMKLSLWVHPKDSAQRYVYEMYLHRIQEVYKDDKFLQSSGIYLEYLSALFNQSRIHDEVDSVLEELDEVVTSSEVSSE